jgi:hypothetical protein
MKIDIEELIEAYKKKCDNPTCDSCSRQGKMDDEGDDTCPPSYYCDDCEWIFDSISEEAEPSNYLEM